MPNQPMSAYEQNHPSKPWLYGAAVLSIMAGLIHLAVTPAHFEEWIGYGLFFLVASIAQLIYAVLLLVRRPTRNLLLAGIIGNGLIIALYVVTRTLGIPFFGPEAGEVEPIGVLDTISKVVELSLIACLVVLWRTQPTSERTDRPAGGAGLLLM